MPGLRMVSEKFAAHERGKAVGIYVGGFTLGAASLSPIVFGYILDLTNPSDAIARFGYVQNWGWAFMILGIGGLMGPLVIWQLKERVTY